MAEEAWKRWGDSDQRGALNHISAACTRAAAARVRDGRIISLAHPISPHTPVPRHRAGVVRLMNRDGGDYASGAERPGGFQFAEDTLILPTHVGTHIDALCHVWYDDRLYNGFSSHTIRSTTGAQNCGVEKLGPVVTTGILFDVVRSRGRALTAGEAITADYLKQCVAADIHDHLRGSCALIRTGWFESRGREPDYFDSEPGLDEDAAIWLAEAGVALVGADNFAVECIPFPDKKVFPVHQRLIRDFGIPLMEGLQLSELSEAGATQFLFVATPLPIVGATASPIAPVAIL